MLEDVFGNALDTVEAAEAIAELESVTEEKKESLPLLEDVFGEAVATNEAAEAIAELESIAQEQKESLPLLEDVFGEVLATAEAAEAIAELESIAQEQAESLPLQENVFGNAPTTSETDREEVLAVAEVQEDTQTADEDEESEIVTIPPEYVADSTVTTSETDADSDSSGIINSEWVANPTPTFVTEEATEETPVLEEVIGSILATPETEANADLGTGQDSFESPVIDTPETLEVAVQHIEQIFDSLPPIEDLPAPTSQVSSVDSTAANPPAASQAASLVPAPQNTETLQPSHSANPVGSTSNEPNQISTSTRSGEATPASNLSVRVDSERLERMNNLVGELAINRNGLSLQNEQLQGSVRDLLNRFIQVQNLVGGLRKLSDQMLVAPQRPNEETLPHSVDRLGELAIVRADFDSLELDSYGVLQSQLQGLLEELMQLEESVDDIVLFAKQSDQTLEQQRQMLTQLRDELMWARMLPLGEVLNRFPRILRDLSTTHRKPASLQLSGTSVLVDKAVLEKLYDPLLHLLRNAFDHGIEFPQERRTRGKPEQGQIEIRAYYRGSQTIVEVRDDGRGLDLERIGRRALEMGLLSVEQLPRVSENRLQELIFEPGFSTKSQVSELSGRGVGLDVVRSQLRSLKGTLSVISQPGVGTTFTLRLPLTLTIAKLLVCFVGSTALALPSDSIEEIIIPKANQIKKSGTKQFLHWREEIVPTYRLSDFLEYACPLSETSPSKALISVPSPTNWALPMLLIRREQDFFALEVDRLVTEQELVIKPFGSAIAPPSCTYGCTILGDGSLIPVIDAAILLEQLLRQGTTATITSSHQKQLTAIGSRDASAVNEDSSASKTLSTIKTRQAPTILVVDDAVALRRTLTLTLERAGFRVLQARDGREAIEQLQQNLDARGQGLVTPSVQLVICDIEMPNMNGFEFLSVRRQEPQMSKIPVVMLTSRSNDKHRWLAMQLGATAYFTKPYLEQEFLAAIGQILSQSTPESLPARS